LPSALGVGLSHLLSLFLLFPLPFPSAFRVSVGCLCLRFPLSTFLVAYHPPHSSRPASTRPLAHPPRGLVRVLVSVVVPRAAPEPALTLALALVHHQLANSPCSLAPSLPPYPLLP
jgi:hypothetical protein